MKLVHEPVHREFVRKTRKHRISSAAETSERTGKDFLRALVTQGKRLSWRGVPKNLSELVDETLYGKS